MSMLALFRGNAKAEAAVAANPYLNARRSWNEHTGSIISSLQIWQAVALIALMTALAAVGGLVFIASQSRFIPHIAEVDKRLPCRTTTPSRKNP